MFDADVSARISQMNAELDADGCDFLPLRRSRARCRSHDRLGGAKLAGARPPDCPCLGLGALGAEFGAHLTLLNGQGRHRVDVDHVRIRRPRSDRRDRRRGSRSIELCPIVPQIPFPPSADRYLRHDPERQHQDRDRCDPGAQDAGHHDLRIAAQAK